MQPQIKIRDKILAPGQPVLITAEVGVTCNYDMEIAKELIDVVKESGADAAKFIFWFPEEIMSDKSITYSYQTTEGEKTEDMFEMLEELKFSLDQWRELKAYADKKGVILFATVNSPGGIDFSEAVGLEAYKLSSWDYNYHTLWRKIAAIGKPVLIDTGPVNTLEVAKVMQIMKEEGNEQSVLVHCLHSNRHVDMNMRAIPYMQKAFDTLVGYSSKDQDSESDIMAITMGSVYLEKRLTMSHQLPGHHHIISLEPEPFAEYVKLIRNVESALGIEDLVPSQIDLEERKKWFRHLVANQDIPRGTVLTADMLEGKRPEKGISPEHIEFFIGRKTNRDLKYNDSLSLDDI